MSSSKAASNKSQEQTQVETAIDNSKEADAITIDRRRGDRRVADANAAENGTSPRPKKQRRRHIDPTTCERDYSNDEIEFMQAMDEYKRDSGRMFPTCSEVLEVVRSLGYVRLTEEEAALLNINEVIEDCDEMMDEMMDDEYASEEDFEEMEV